MHPLPTTSLVGADVGAVGARLGPPLSCAAVGEEVHLGYGGLDRDLVADAVVLVDGVVLRTRPCRRSPPSLHGYWIGQPIECLLANFGAPVAVVTGMALQELTLPAFQVCVHEGRVVAIGPRSLTRAS